MENHKHYLVSWSGGLDSTALIYRLLKGGHRVSALYTNILNNAEKADRELRAIQIIRDVFETNSNFKYLGHNDIHVNVSSYTCLAQVPAFICSLVYATSEHYDAVAIAYVLNDDAISYVNDIQRIWNSYRSMKIDLPPLSFPLSKASKQELYGDLPDNIKHHITWCEEADLSSVHTCSCKPCKRMKEILPSIVSNESICVAKKQHLQLIFDF